MRVFVAPYGPNQFICNLEVLAWSWFKFARSLLLGMALAVIIQAIRQTDGFAEPIAEMQIGAGTKETKL
jgi:hypothetical protein